MKIVTVLGARPQFIKAATVSRALLQHHVDEVIVHTGQHYDSNMSEVFFREMEIPAPTHQLQVGNLSHAAMTGRMMEQIEQILGKEKPDSVLVYGDTNSTLAGALAAVKLHIPVAHVEAGLRSHNMSMPEEVNRILTDRISQWLFCPTSTAVRNLELEGFRHMNCVIEQPGDVMFDAVLYYRSKATLRNQTLPKRFVLTTVHRAENTDHTDNLKNIVDALNQISKDTQVVWPLHPRTRKHIASLHVSPTVHLLEPFSYFEMLGALDACEAVITDSGGLQKEAYFFGKPCITVREETEWVELVEARANTLTGADTKRIISAWNSVGSTTVSSSALYGDGHAAEKIAGALTRQ